MLVQVGQIHLCEFVCAIAIFTVCISGGYGSEEMEISYDNGIKGLRDIYRNANEDSIKNTKRSGTMNSTVGLWFGPRLGKRRKSTEKAEIDPSDVEVIEEQLNPGLWALISVPRNRRADGKGDFGGQLQTFTPRLGRELAERLLAKMHSDKDNKDTTTKLEPQLRERIPLFVPRTGREMLIMPSPILERDFRVCFGKLCFNTPGRDWRNY